ncbi:MAG: hypothetical protein R3336_03315, partial [Phycisphaeraceae bacterium]|nr:hypothetical protein [Phycisphaeraceae bacterium]
MKMTPWRWYNRTMLKLATLLDNPGEPLPETRYRDPARLAELGYNGLVLFGTTSISGVARPDSVGGGEMQRWVQQQIDHVRERIAAAQEAGLEVYMTIDALSLPSALVGRESEQMQCKGRSKSICPASDGALEAATSAVVDQIGQLAGIDGIVLRIGDSDAGRYPYLVGNDVYSPHCA